jgi:hypothetical protein
MLNKFLQQILRAHNAEPKTVHISDHPQEIIMLFHPTANTYKLTQFLTNCQIPFEMSADNDTKSLCIFF